MKRKRLSVEQIVGVLKQAKMGVPVAERIRQVGIAEQTLYRWKRHYRRLGVLVCGNDVLIPVNLPI